MPQIDPDGIHIIEDRALVVYDPQVREHTPAGYITDPVTGELVPSGKIVQLPASAIPLSGDAGNSLTLSPVDGKLYVAPTAVINVADDQGLTASETATALVTVNSTSVASTVDGVAETTVNHDFHVDVKVAPTPASGVQNSLKVTTSGLYVAKEVLGEGTPPVSNGRPSLSTRYFGDPAILMGTPLGWVDLAELHSDGSTTLYTLGYFKKVVVPAGENVFTYVPPSGGEVLTEEDMLPEEEELPEEESPDEEVPPEEEVPPIEGEGDGNELPPAEDVYTTALNNFSTIVDNGASARWTTNYRAFQAVALAVSQGSLHPPANWYELSAVIVLRMQPVASTFEDHVVHVQFMRALGFNAFDLTVWSSMVSGAISTSAGNLAGTSRISTQFDSQNQFLKVVPGAENSLVAIFHNNQFVWTTDPAAATLFSSVAVSAILANISFSTIRGAAVGEFAKIGNNVQVD